MLGTLNGALEVRGVSLGPDAIKATVRGVNEIRDGLPVLTRIEVHYRLRIPAASREIVELGYLNPNYLVGGELTIDAERSRQALQENIAGPMGLDLAEAAYGAHQIVASNMIRAIRAISSERGRDPRDYSLFTFGGNGPLFAATMASALGMRRIVVPPSPGLFSSFGLLYADVEHHYSRSLMSVLRDTDPAALTATWQALEADARAQLTRDGFEPRQIKIERTANTRAFTVT